MSAEGPSPRDVLGRTPIFAEALNDEQLHFLAAQSRIAFFRERTLLMSQGDLGSSMFVLVNGLVDISFIDRAGRKTIVAQLTAGDIVGEMSLFTGDRRSADAVAVANVTAVEISKAALERLFAKAPDLLERFATLLARRQGELKAVEGAAAEDAADFRRQARRFFRSLFGRAKAGA